MRTITGSVLAAISALLLLSACGSGPDGHTSALGTVEAACVTDGGCTLTQGYWKTHSKYGPAPYDDAWAIFEAGPLNDPDDTIYHRSIPCYDTLGLTWYEQLWTAPRGNVWLLLAHQYTAAWLNYYNGADIGSIHDELDVEARALLAICPGDPDFAAKRGDFLRVATLLDRFNNGLVGPPHCTDE